MRKLLFLFILLPVISFSQNAIIKNIYLASKDSIKTISYPVIKSNPEASCTIINNTIKAFVFNPKEYDTAQALQSLLKALYKKDKALKMGYTVTRNTNGLLSITISIIPSIGDRKPTIYLNFDLNTGQLITIGEMLKTKNDSISFRQAIIPTITDSIRLFEQTIDINNPKYSNIIEWLNGSLSIFRQHYPTDYSLTDNEIVVYFDCFMPNSLLPYYHTYQVSFNYKTLKNMLKQDIVNRLK